MNTKTDKGTANTGHVTLSPTGVLQIKFPYDPVVINRVKTLSGRLWHSGPKHWTAPATLENIAKLREWKFSLSGDVVKPVLDELAARTAKPPAKPLDFGDLATALDADQIDGVRQAEAFGGRALFADDPGFGKTPQVLAWLRLHPEARPAVVVTKKTGKLVWQKIAKRGILSKATGKWVPLLPDDRVQVVNSEQDADIDADVVIVNYDVLARTRPCEACNGEGEHTNGLPCDACNGSGKTVYLREDVAAIKPVAVCLDEPQMISNYKAQRTVAARQLYIGVRHLLSATASPIKRRPKQFFTVLNATRPDLFPSFFKYGLRYCDGHHTGYGWKFEGASNTEELYAILTAELMIRRRTRDTMNVPEPCRQIVPLAIRNKAEYERADTDFMEWLWKQKDDERYDKARRAEGLVRASTLLRMAAERKEDAVIEWLHDFFDDEDGSKKLIAFTMHTALLERVVREFKHLGAVYINGSCSTKQRQKAEELFQNDPACRLMVCNSDAGGDTWTGTAAYDVAFLELPKTPEDVKQNEGRAYARRNDPHGINSWFLVAADTIEEKRAEQLNEGARVVSAVLDGKAIDEGEDMIDLIQRYKGGVK